MGRALPDYDNRTTDCPMEDMSKMESDNENDDEESSHTGMYKRNSARLK